MRVRLVWTLYCLLFAGTTGLLAQGSASDVAKDLTQDLNTYTENFVTSFTTSLVWGIQSGWYNTAKPHEPLGFDLTITGRLVRVPDSDFLFDFVNTDYNTMTSSSGQLPTLTGPVTQEQVTFNLEDSGTGTPFSTSIEAPDGIQSELIGEKYVPIPMVQVGVGIYAGTDIMVRWTPGVSISGFDINFFGLGLRHDWGQWVPGLKEVPIDLSVLIAYNQQRTEVEINDAVGITGQNQRAEFDTQAWTFQALISKEIKVLTVYGGLGYNTASTDVKVLGQYIFESGPLSLDVVDPVNFTSKNTGVNATLGLRLKFAVFTMHADYNFQEYNSITAGIGFSFR